MARRGLTPEAVASAALAVVDADGPDAVTIKRVADDLGVRPPSLYNHVAGRDELLTTVTVGVLDELAGVVTDAVVGRAGDEALVAAAHAYRDWALAHPGRASLTVRAPAAGGEDHAAAGRRVEAVFTAATRAWALGEDRQVHVVRALRATVLGFVQLETTGGFGRATSVDASFDVAVRALVDGLGPA